MRAQLKTVIAREDGTILYEFRSDAGVYLKLVTPTPLPYQIGQHYTLVDAPSAS